MSFVESFGEFLKKYLNHADAWEHSSLKSIGEIERLSPWREDNYRHANGWYITHWQNLKTPSHMSMPSPSHVWKISNGNGWVLSLSFGVAPYVDE